jgi:hypothetical protein
MFYLEDTTMIAYILSFCFMVTGLFAYAHMEGINEALGICVGLGCFILSVMFGLMGALWEDD